MFVRMTANGRLLDKKLYTGGLDAGPSNNDAEGAPAIIERALKAKK